MKAFLICVALGMVTGCIADYSEKQAEFVCYTDGELTERHVGIAKAYRNAGAWVVTYKEGNRVVYVQQRGESCGVEEIGSK